jgi:hypothetical protein
MRHLADIAAFIAVTLIALAPVFKVQAASFTAASAVILDVTD